MESRVVFFFVAQMTPASYIDSVPLFFWGSRPPKNRNFLEMKWWMKIGISKKKVVRSHPLCISRFLFSIYRIYLRKKENQPIEWTELLKSTLNSQPHWMFIFHELNTHNARLARSVVHHLLHAPFPLGHPRLDSQNLAWEGVNSCDPLFLKEVGS